MVVGAAVFWKEMADFYLFEALYLLKTREQNDLSELYLVGLL